MAFNSEVENGRLANATGGSGLGSFVLRQLLKRMPIGRLTVVTPTGERLTQEGCRPGTDAVLKLHRWRAIRKLLTGGDLGLAESYIAGDWSSPDLAAMLTHGCENARELDKVIGGQLPVKIMRRIGHFFNRNNRAGSRRNIAFHYDLGNEFYKLWLDQSMTYSAALYRDPQASLAQAQQEKLTRIADLLGAQPGDDVLEIGCGWGALAACLARRGARVTGLTLSQEQQAYAREIVNDAGLGNRVDIRLEDYRDAGGQFDKVASIEMVEAVGEAYWPTYFAALRDRLKTGGVAVLQAITIDETQFESYRQTPDFIQRYIFPGGMLPTPSIIAEQARRVGLAVSSVETFGQGYALTVAEWRRRFVSAWPSIERLGFDQRFRRMWEYYLCYCEAGFRTGLVDVGLYRLQG